MGGGNSCGKRLGHEKQTPPPAQNKRAHALPALGPHRDPLPPGHPPMPHRC